MEFFGAFAFEGDISICMEFMDLGSFDHIVKVFGTVPEDVVAKITQPVLKGLMCKSQTEIQREGGREGG